MNLIERVKNILLTPKTEWEVINGETATPQSLLTGYVLPLALLSAAGPLLTGLLWAGVLGLKYYIITAVIAFISVVAGFYISAYVIDLLAPNFGSEKNLNKSAQLVAYSNTPNWVAGALSFIPVLGLLIVIAGWVYSIYLMYLGIGPLKKSPEDKKVVYLIVAFLIMFAIGIVIGLILGAILFAAMGIGVAGRRLF
jgi:Yip1 domain